MTRLITVVSLMATVASLGVGSAHAQTGEEDERAPATQAEPAVGSADDPGPDPVDSTTRTPAETPPEPTTEGTPDSGSAEGAEGEPAGPTEMSDLERAQVQAEGGAEGAAGSAADATGEDGDEESEDGESLDHELQVGIRAGAGVPFTFALRYGDGARCDTGGNNFCVFVGSGVVDVDLSFGVSPDLEITTMGRFGMVGVEPTEQNQILLGLGIRSYLAPESVAKFFLGVRLILDITQAGGVTEWGDVDFGVRGEFGLQVDIVRYVGLYAQVGVNVTFLRAFGISPDVTGGFQVRFP